MIKWISSDIIHGIEKANALARVKKFCNGGISVSFRPIYKED